MSEECIMARMQEHLAAVQDQFGDSWVGLFLQGSQNYKLDYEDSDIDTKAIVLPSFSDFVLTRKPVSTTHVIYKFCNELAKTWSENAPDMRFGQLMTNIFNAMQAQGYDPFFPEEDEMMVFIKNCLCNTKLTKTERS